MSWISTLKAAALPAGRRPRKIPIGLYRGLVFDLDLASDTQLVMGLQERETHKRIKSAIAWCDWAIDVGAGKGELTVLLLKRGVRRVYAFEPLATEVVQIHRNLGLNNLAGSAALNLVSQLVGHRDQSGTVTLDSLNVDRSAKGFLKVDVEGAELDVLQGGHALLAQASVEVMVETHSRRLETECAAFLEHLGLRCNVILNAPWRAIIPERRPAVHNRWLWASRSPRT